MAKWEYSQKIELGGVGMMIVGLFGGALLGFGIAKVTGSSMAPASRAS
jgi:hypothetical protein